MNKIQQSLVCKTCAFYPTHYRVQITEPDNVMLGMYPHMRKSEVSHDTCIHTLLNMRALFTYTLYPEAAADLCFVFCLEISSL